MKNKSKTNGEIELLRFFFAVAVLLFHAVKYFRGEPERLGAFEPYFFIHGAVGVEFFFICSGFFMARSVAGKISKNGPAVTDLGRDTVSFMIRKVKSIAPVHIVFFITAFISLILVRSMGLKDIVKNAIDSVPAFFLVQMAGFKGFSPNHVSWYLSVMLISMFVIYPIARRYYSVFVRVVAPVSALFILGYLFFKYGSLTGVMVRCGIFYKSLLRGFAEIMIGMTVYEVAEWFRTLKMTTFRRAMITVSGLILIAGSAVYIMHTLSAKYEFLFIPISAVLMVLAYSEQGLLYGTLNNGVSVFLGKLTLPVYLSQVTMINLISHYGESLSFTVKTLILAGGVLVMSLLYLGARFVLDKYSASRHNNTATVP